ncbi:MAG: AP2 domain-containing protein [Proteobacteria bacterium]|nr:AP2 domain-containing protein [Pseudomonadota bacterium]
MYAIRLCGTGLAWEVLLYRRCKVHKKMFPFSKWGDKNAALLAARAWRDEQVRLHAPMPLAERAGQLTKANTSGVPGVRCELWPDGAPRAWFARTKIRNRGFLTNRFAVSVYGEEGAKARAIAAREQHLTQMKGHMGVHPAAVPAPGAPVTRAPLPVAEAKARRTRIEGRSMSNNKSGISGVGCVRGPDGEPIQWKATLGTTNRGFSVRKYGAEEARRRAIEARQAFLDGIWPDGAQGR